MVPAEEFKARMVSPTERYVTLCCRNKYSTNNIVWLLFIMFEVSILITENFIEQIAIFSNIKTPVFYPTNATINVYHR